jgi:peptidoglycan L-alanyl-D-glutamate endopeptidase CwlK
MFKFSNRSIDNLKGVHPRLVILMGVALQNSPVDFTITDGVRTTAQQQVLYAQGRTAPGKIVTNLDGVKEKSKHQIQADGQGHAIDLYPYVNGKVQTEDTANLKHIAKHIKATAKRLGYNIEWGGDWKNFVDMPHFELKA